jgi:SagB-type dehydrogenase family enzyme
MNIELLLKPDAKTAEDETDRSKSLPPPVSYKEIPPGAILVDLLQPEQLQLGMEPLINLIRHRRSRRKYNREYFSLEELSFLLWATQGIRKDDCKKRCVPSGGNCHPFETYLFINRIENLKQGLYRYLPITHKLLFLYEDQELIDKIAAASLKYQFVKESAVIFIWTAVPYRTEWRYNSNFAAKLIALDAGHVCQNLYLASESIHAGTCAIAYYDQEKWDQIIGVDGRNEFTVYLAAVGKVARE